MSQAPEGDVFLVVETDTIIRGVFTNFKNAGKWIVKLEIEEDKEEGTFRIKPFRIQKNLIDPLIQLTIGDAK